MGFNFVTRGLIKQILKEEPHDVIVEDINKIPFYLPLFFKLPHLAVIPHLFGRSIYSEVNPIVATYVYLSEKPIKRVYRTSRFLVISNSTKDDLITRGLPADRISVAECGVDHDFYTVGADVERFQRPTVIYLGRVKKYKSVHHLVEALPTIRKSVPDVQLIIVGDGDYLEKLKELTKKLHQEDMVKFTGYIPAVEKLDYLRKSHVAVYPSPKEGWGLTNIEANACGTPVVAADSPGLRDSVSPGKSGLLYEYGNRAELAEKVASILTDSDLFRTLSEGALQWAARFTWDDCARRSFAVIEQTLAEGARQ